MRLYTIQMGKYRIATAQGYTITDTTVKSGGDSPFKPTWDIVRDVKAGVITECQYTTAYLHLMRRSYINRREEWLEFLRQPTAVIACYCGNGKFCHRYILTRCLAMVAARHAIEFEYLGELT